MAARSTVTTHDLRRLLDLGDPCRLDGGGDPLPWSVLDDLAALVGCDDLSYLVQDPTSRQVFTDQSLLPAPSLAACDAEAIDDWYWQHFWACQCSYPERSGDYTTVTRASGLRVSAAIRPRSAGRAVAHARGPLRDHGPVTAAWPHRPSHPAVPKRRA